MLRFAIIAAVVVFVSDATQPNIIFKTDITPEEAQKYLQQLPFNNPQLSERTAILPLVRYDDPKFRSADAGPTNGHYWKNGQEIVNTDDYVEEVYNAAQYHGQDGLGQYAYGYETPESSKVEDRKGSGVVSGSYVYKVPGQKDLVEVRYYADSQGFHQEDNLPKVVLKPAEETPALKEARLAFEKAWKEAAEANSHQPTVQPPIQNLPQYGNFQAQASEQDAVVVSAPSAAATQARDGKALAYSQAQSFQQGNQQQYGQQQQYAQQKYEPKQQVGEDGKYEEPEPTGPPRGFFYSFNYPVSIIVPKNEQNHHGAHPVDYDTVGINQ